MPSDCQHPSIVLGATKEGWDYRCSDCNDEMVVFKREDTFRLGKIAEKLNLSELVEYIYEFAIELQSRVNGL